MNHEIVPSIAPPTSDKSSDLIETILENPDEVFTYDDGACYLAAIEGDGTWDVWSYCEESRSLCHEGSFDTYVEALSHARARGEEILEEIAEAQADLEDAAWEARAATTVALTAPFTFTDTTDFQAGVELKDAEAVYAFFRRRKYLLRPEAWGNLYSCGLTDDEGVSCWVTANRRGDLRLEAEV